MFRLDKTELLLQQGNDSDNAPNCSTTKRGAAQYATLPKTPPTAGACPTGPALREARRQRGLSQSDLSGILGISQSRVSAWERGYDEVPQRLRRQLIDVLLNKNGVLDPIIRKLVANDPILAVHLPTVTDGFPDFVFQHVAQYPKVDLLKQQDDCIGQRVSDYFDLGWYHDTYPERSLREKLMFDVERDIVTSRKFGNQALYRIRTHHMFLEFEGRRDMILARHTMQTNPTQAPSVIHDALFIDQLD
ncbi:MAG: helix-turn-helix transcriptional regulator [Rhizobiaceae bacterium]